MDLVTPFLVSASLATDAYKLDHRRQYPQPRFVDGAWTSGTTRVYSNFTARGSRIPGITAVTAFAIQSGLKYVDVLFGQWFARPEDAVCEEYETFVLNLLGPNDIGSDHIRALHRLGYLPIEVRAIPEGREVPLRVPIFTIENTVDEFYWVVNYLETILSDVIWFPMTSATQARRLRELLDEWAEKTGDPAFVQWQGHDFSFRGHTSLESACVSGAGHLLFFTGTDTLPAIQWVQHYYPTNEFIGGSVAATEHSVMCAGGQVTERDTFERLRALYAGKIFSVVSDTWDLFKVLTEIVPEMKDELLSVDGTKMVIRPDSGDPVKIICGDPDAPEGSPEFKGVAEILWDIFGGTVNEKGYKVLDPHIGMIYGDSINYDRAEAICKGLAAKGFASTNIVLGVGSYTYQYVTRDTFGFAMKATWAMVDGVGVDMWKDPKTDGGEKKSAKGRLAVLENHSGKLYLVEQASALQEQASVLQPVYRDGKFLVTRTFDEVRRMAA